MTRYLSDYLTKEQQKEIFNRKGDISIITAPTGAGKTTLIMDNTIKTLDTNLLFGNRKTLILCNRTALYTQIRMDLELKLSKAEIKEGIDKEFVKNNLIHVMTYQKLYISMLENKNFLDDYEVIICDECHYFINDGWNHITYLTLEKLIEFSKTNTVLFFSATTKEIKYWLDIYKISNKVEKSIYTDIIPTEDAIRLGYNDRLEIIITDMGADDIIKSIPKGEKFILFMNENTSRDRLIKKSKQYENVGYIHSMWLSAKNGKIYPDEDMKKKFNHLVFNKSFTKDGLVTNSAMDNGVSIEDTSVKYIIIDHIENMTQIIQMIGRKRFNPNNPDDRCRVYICCGNSKEFKRMYDKYKDMQEPSIDYKYVEEGKMSLEEFLDKYNDKVERNTVRIKSTTKDTHIEVLKQFKKKLDRKEIDKTFPFIIWGSEPHVMVNNCYRFNIDERVINLNNIFEHQKKGYKIQEFLCICLRQYYSNVDYRITQETISYRRNQGSIDIPKVLDMYVNEVIESKEVTRIRKELCKKYSLRNLKRNLLNHSEFEIYISTLGYSLEKIIKNRKTYYRLYK